MSATVSLPILPRTRADCVSGGRLHARPCPFVACRFHLAQAVSERRSAPPPRQMTEATCTLDVAARGGATLDDVGKILGVTRERIRQIEIGALAKLRLVCKRHGIQFDDLIVSLRDRSRA